MLHSFAKHHPDFSGDFCIIYDKLSSENKKTLLKFDNCRLLKVSENLKSRTQSLANTYPALNTKIPRFYSLELLRLNGYKKIIFCDGDLLFLQPVSELFKDPASFLAAREFIAYLGYVREKSTFNEVENVHSEGALTDTFNAGFMILDGKLANETSYKDILKYLGHSFWKNIAHHTFTDQMVFNYHFQEHGKRIPIEYNYILKRRKELQPIVKLTPLQAKVVHFNGTKPWELEKYRIKMEQDPMLFPLFKMWQENYYEALRYLLMKKLKG